MKSVRKGNQKLKPELDQGVNYSIEASSFINTGVETTRSHLAD